MAAIRQLPQARPDPLSTLRRQLGSEFGSAVSHEVIDRAAAEALAELRGARVREFVSVLALRRARERLRSRTA